MRKFKSLSGINYNEYFRLLKAISIVKNLSDGYVNEDNYNIFLNTEIKKGKKKS